MKRAVLYLRVSKHEQTIENQRIELERVAAARGWKIVSVFKDEGISGAFGRGVRKQYDAMLKGGVRAEYDVVMAWDVSRLSRSLKDLVQTLEELQACKIDLYLHQQFQILMSMLFDQYYQDTKTAYKQDLNLN